MEWKRLVLGVMETNGYLLIKGKHCLLFDPGSEKERILEYVERRQLTPLAIFLTHTHFDHIGAADDIRMKYGIPLYVHERESDWLDNPMLNGSALFFPNRPMHVKAAEEKIFSEGTLEIGEFSLAILETPGHSPGSVSYYIKEENIVISGDTLFEGSIGRTDLPGGNFPELMESIQKKLLTLPEDTTVLPGHGPVTTIKDEKKSNPFLSYPG